MSEQGRIGNLLKTEAELADGQWSIALTEPNGAMTAGYQTDRPHEAASLNKLAIVHALDASGVRIETSTVKPEDKRPERSGTGILGYFPDGYEVPFTDVVRLMLSESDNTAARIAVRELGGPGSVNDLLEDSPLGLEATRLELVDTDRFYYGNTTAEETTALLREIDQDEEHHQALLKSHCWYGLRRDIEDRRLKQPLHRRFLKWARGRGPDRLYEQALAYRSPSSQFPAKEGSVEDVRHDSARIGGYVIAALSSNQQEKPYGEKHPAHRVHARIGRLILKNCANGLDPQADSPEEPKE